MGLNLEAVRLRMMMGFCNQDLARQTTTEQIIRAQMVLEQLRLEESSLGHYHIFLSQTSIKVDWGLESGGAALFIFALSGLNKENFAVMSVMES